MTWTNQVPQGIYEKCSVTQDGVVYKFLYNYPNGLNSVTLLFYVQMMWVFSYTHLYYHPKLCQIQINELDIIDAFPAIDFNVACFHFIFLSFPFRNSC